MKKRCASSTPIEAGCLRGRRLEFTAYSSHWRGGVADVVPEQAAEVWGVVYEISNEDLKRLDEYEGEGSCYKRFQTTIEASSGIVADVWVYEVIDRGGPFRPSREYLRIMKEAAEWFKFPKSYITALDANRK